MKAFADRLATASELLAVALTAGVFAVMLVQIWFRYVLNDSLLWSEEISTWGLVWIVFLGAVAVARDWRHVNVPIVVDLLPARVRAVARILAKMIVLVFLVFLTGVGIDAFGQGFHRVSPLLGLSTKWAKLAIPVGAGLMSILTVVVIVEDLRAFLGRDEDAAAGPRKDRGK